ncbi:zonular occludens toxin domain-containing protein [Halarcobacter sp.]|uniref:zonular occludens toxin domain-containing protein n=1 Tax=Halarcobacter sp. TaxID=2321133 RepID=UPI002AAB787E|nr:zonular occludens toxin domain-containing protein [Halarcobacter sp.]
MITFYTGIPRSGKTLKTVYDIYFEFIFDKKTIGDKLKEKLGKEVEVKEDKYLYLCTNINQFNFDLSDKFYKLDFKDLYEKLEILYKLYMIHKPDYEIIEKAKELKLYKVLFVFDECHNYFKDKKDDILVWWLTYHGHIYHDIILITQDMSLLSKEYKTQGEQFYKAIPQTYRLSKNVFKYSLYSSYNMYQKDFIKSITIKPIKEVFEMYVSGDSAKSKSILHKYIYMFFILLILCIFSFMYVINYFTPQVKEDTLTTFQNNEETIVSKETLSNDSAPGIAIKNLSDSVPLNDDVSDTILMSFKCSVKYGYCLYKNKKISLNTYLKLKDLFQVVELSTTKLNNDFVQLDVLAKSNFYNVFYGGNTNEKNTTNNINLLQTTAK